MDGLAAGGEVPTGRLPVTCEGEPGLALLFLSFYTGIFFEPI
jgi:hypothetical protein